MNDTSETRFKQETLLTYRAYLAFLEAQRVLLREREIAERADPIEGPGAAQRELAAARRRIDTISPPIRAVFEAVFEQERQETQRQLDAELQRSSGGVRQADPDTVAQQALSGLLDEARGRHRDDGRGIVPLGKPDSIRWYSIDLADLDAAPPTDADYAVHQRVTSPMRKVGINIGLALAALLLIGAVALGARRADDAGAPDAPQPVSNGQRLAPWAVRAVTGNDGAWTLPVTTTTARWPAERGAYLLAGSLAPIQLCLPGETLAQLEQLTLRGAATAPDRLFVLSDAPQPDLAIVDCADPAERRTAVIRAVLPTPFLRVGEPATERLTVAAIAISGRGDDPTLPEGQARVTVTVRDRGEEPDYVARNPVLLTPDGAQLQPSKTDRRGDEVVFAYLIAAPPEPIEVVWQLLQGRDPAIRYRATLPVPPGRQEVLRALIQVKGVTVARSEQTMAITVELATTADRPLLLTPDDITFRQRDQAVPLAISDIQQPIPPAGSRLFTITLTAQDGVLQIGPYRYEVSIERG